jgi:hypothetical protein
MTAIAYCHSTAERVCTAGYTRYIRIEAYVVGARLSIIMPWIGAGAIVAAVPEIPVAVYSAGCITDIEMYRVVDRV